ncbi:UDP-glycoslytransferase 3 [Artemisia annua]|uniref:UDP-glycoslytransferase 3 n=1 Tax=Artemisia annua TaxID=35608 RepID=A0A2U1LSG6_ARTAN|nr:UDP-glycoslytransferase 3 [Artemisia annua]
MELPGDPIGINYTNSFNSSLTDDDKDRIQFIHFPPIDPDLFIECPTVNFRANAVIEAHRPIIRELVASQFEGSQDQAPHLNALIVDMFCKPMIDVGKEFGVPTYMFLISNAVFLWIILYIPTLQDEHGQDISALANSTTELMIPSYAVAVPPSVCHICFWTNLRSKGLIVISEVYTVGPMLKPEKPKPNSDVLQWDQVKEIAIAVEKSGYRIRWSLRRPPTEDLKNFPGEYTDYNEVLPNGFLERTADKGKVVGWVPQTEVLANVAVGGFISHCGWNSVKESLWYTVPAATWPMYAEQQLNAFELVKELGLAVEISLDYNQLSKD